MFFFFKQKTAYEMRISDWSSGVCSSDLRTYQLNVGGNMDFKNMLERERLESKKVSKTQSVTSNLKGELANKTSDRNVHIGPSDYVQWLDDRKWRSEERRVGQECGSRVHTGCSV